MIKTDVPDLVKDETSGALLNTNNAALASYKMKKKQIAEMKNIHERLNKLEDTMSLILTELRNQHGG